jgi:hypothetical protein
MYTYMHLQSWFYTPPNIHLTLTHVSPNISFALGAPAELYVFLSVKASERIVTDPSWHSVVKRSMYATSLVLDMRYTIIF